MTALTTHSTLAQGRVGFREGDGGGGGGVGARRWCGVVYLGRGRCAVREMNSKLGDMYVYGSGFWGMYTSKWVHFARSSLY